MIPPPQTFYDCLALMLGLLYLLGHREGGGGAPVGRLPDPNTINVRRCAGGAAGLAVFTFVMVSAANDVHGFAPLLRFLAWLPSNYNALAWPWIVLPSVGIVALLGCVSVFRLLAGWRGPFPPRRSMMPGGDFLMLAGAAGVWFWGGLFIEEQGSWLGHCAHVWNFGLTALLLFLGVHAAVSMLVLLGNGGGGAEGMIEKFRKRRNAPMVSAKPRKY